MSAAIDICSPSTSNGPLNLKCGHATPNQINQQTLFPPLKSAAPTAQLAPLLRRDRIAPYRPMGLPGGENAASQAQSFGACLLAVAARGGAQRRFPLQYNWGGFYVGAHMGGAGTHRCRRPSVPRSSATPCARRPARWRSSRIRLAVRPCAARARGRRQWADLYGTTPALPFPAFTSAPTAAPR